MFGGVNDSAKRKVIKAMIRSQRVDMFCLQETKIQSMTEGLVRSLGTGRMRNVEDGRVWMFTGVYGPFSKEEREWMWEELGAIRGIWEDPWCIGGDFNVTLSLRERSNQGRLTSAMRRFAQVVDELELIDLPLQGGMLTWSGGRNNQAWARLDRFLVTQGWLDHFNEVVQCRLPRPTSDHFPIVLMGGGIRRGLSPFRFENMWLKVDGFSDLLRGWWQEIEVFGRLEVNKNSALQQVEFWDGVERERSLSEGETELKKEAKDPLKNGMANAHRRNNSLERMKINGVWLTEEKEMREGIVSAFQQVQFSEEEIYAALMGMNGDKAPGPDGFTIAFWQSSWGLVKEEIMDLFREFYNQRSFANSLNSTFLVLIPKKGGAEDLGDFRPISLLGSLYKLLAKVLANRLKKVLDKVVSGDQNAFVRGKQILDASLIANEVIDFWNKRKENGLICKLDIEKAYDSINWRFLMKVLVKMGFGSRWLEWMWWCISTAKFSVMINGVPAGFFSNSKGLRQGDPISPYLFVLGMEVLSILIRRAVDGGFLSGCNIKGRGEEEMIVSHLLFADDTIIFCEANKEQVSALSWVLAWFEAASGLRINLDKSVLIPVGEVENIEELAVELGCKIGMLPTVYLGLPLGAHHKAVSIWDGVEERMRKRLAQWKRQYISKGGRLTLIKCTMASLPIYIMSLFRMPKSVVKRLEKIQRDFLWGGGSLERKVHLIKWEVVCTSKEKGGLGMRRIESLNKALLGKWVWRFAVEKDNLWRVMIGVKYGQEEFGWKTKEGRGAYGVGAWKEIMKEANWCWENIKFKVGKGTRIKFWLDQWCGDERLSHAFPLLYEMAVNKNATVNEMWDHSSGPGGWNLRFHRDFNDWKLDLIRGLLIRLRDVKLSSEEDGVLWKEGGGGAWEVWGECKSHSSSLYGGKGLMGYRFCPCGGSLGVPRAGEGGFIQLEGPLCGEKKEKNLEFYLVVYFWTVWKERIGVADRVCLGLLPSSEGSWATAVRALRCSFRSMIVLDGYFLKYYVEVRTEGGMLHVHGNAKDSEEGSWSEHVSKSICDLARSEGYDWEVSVEHVERVKWYAPHIRHLVADVRCRQIQR
ncbi:LINE-1 reverse transcriptase-like [Vitis vinifera]|uniref:LINE-1 reverse transcriptase-like n=1 Tax=Vitis vinifera TaxID=29760 RepID=A0A438EED4_VITVI|nr:LINE-1 reverse transcriptase-like [Vitis vinifera]